MKKKSFKFETIRPPLEMTGTEIENILRWEDDGGFISSDVVELTIMLRSDYHPVVSEFDI